jgi:hypothetical protein
MALMIWAPMQYAQAGMIGTEQVVAAAAQADRNAVLNFIGRAEVTSQLQSLGIDPSTAKDRVAAMSDQEVQQLAGRIQTMPAGASDAGWILFIVVVAAVVWWVWFRR